MSSLPQPITTQATTIVTTAAATVTDEGTIITTTLSTPSTNDRSENTIAQRPLRPLRTKKPLITRPVVVKERTKVVTGI